MHYTEYILRFLIIGLFITSAVFMVHQNFNKLPYANSLDYQAVIVYPSKSQCYNYSGIVFQILASKSSISSTGQIPFYYQLFCNIGYTVHMAEKGNENYLCTNQSQKIYTQSIINQVNDQKSSTTALVLQELMLLATLGYAISDILIICKCITCNTCYCNNNLDHEQIQLNNPPRLTHPSNNKIISQVFFCLNQLNRQYRIRSIFNYLIFDFASIAMTGYTLISYAGFCVGPTLYLQHIQVIFILGIIAYIINVYTLIFPFWVNIIQIIVLMGSHGYMLWFIFQNIVTYKWVIYILRTIVQIVSMIVIAIIMKYQQTTTITTVPHYLHNEKIIHTKPIAEKPIFINLHSQNTL